MGGNVFAAACWLGARGVAVLRVAVVLAPIAHAAGPVPSSHCPGVDIVTAAAPPADIALVCDGARRAVAFFRWHGVEPGGPFVVRLRDEPIGAQGTHIGQYEVRADRIDLLTLSRARELCSGDPPFGVSMDERLYVSFVAHEVAHAIAERPARSGRIGRLAQEYLAYTSQLATMDPALREAILANHPVPGFADVSEMSWVYYGLAPAAFGVKSYRHYVSLPDPGPFVRALVSGDVVPGR